MKLTFLAPFALLTTLVAQPQVEIQLSRVPPEALSQMPFSKTTVFVLLKNVSQSAVVFLEADPLADYGIRVRRADDRRIAITSYGKKRRFNSEPQEPTDVDMRSYRVIRLAAGETVFRDIELAQFLEFEEGTYVVELQKGANDKQSSLFGAVGKRSVPSRRMTRKLELDIGPNGQPRQ